jgi:ABC-type transporter Mla MlaB component
MLMITRIESGDSTWTLKLEGKIQGPWVGELRNACDEAQTAPGCIRLDLAAVTFVDAAGVRLLDDLIRQGMTIAGCSGFVAELLNLRRR